MRNAPPAPASALIALLLGGCLAAPPHPTGCDAVTPLFAVDADQDSSQLAPDCFEWVEQVRGRVARSGTASAVVWRGQTAAGPALLISAVHTLGQDWPWPAGMDAPETLSDPADSVGIARVTLVAGDGSGLADDRSPLFMLYTPAVPAEENRDGLQDILPARDFYFAALDGQTLAATSSHDPQPLTFTAPALHDPSGLALDPLPPRHPNAGEHVLLVGYPIAPPFNGAATAGVGRVLDDAEAGGVIAMLSAAGDLEGDIPYDHHAEMIIEGFAGGGMSGGGVFDIAGDLVGVIVRASDQRDDRQYVRAVRLTHALDELQSAIGAVPEPTGQAVRAYLVAPGY